MACKTERKYPHDTKQDHVEAKETASSEHLTAVSKIYTMGEILAAVKKSRDDEANRLPIGEVLSMCLRQFSK